MRGKNKPSVRIKSPSSKKEIANALMLDMEKGVAVFGQFSSEEFFRRPAEKTWSPSEHLTHLILSIEPIISIVLMPAVSARYSLGGPENPPRSFDEIIALYEEAMHKDNSAGKYEPKHISSSTDLKREQKRRINKWKTAVRRLTVLTKRWYENGLDEVGLKHPKLGNLSLREMLFFTIYHNERHINSIKNRLEAMKTEA